MCPRRDLRDVLRRRLAELARIVSYNRAVECQRMEVHILPERAVRPLHERERAYLGMASAARSRASLAIAASASARR